MVIRILSVNYTDSLDLTHNMADDSVLVSDSVIGVKPETEGAPSEGVLLSPPNLSRQLKFDNGEEEPPSPGFGMQDLAAAGPAARSRRFRKKRDSEWVFRPLRLKFRVKELEQLYKNSVYRQQQSLLYSVCVLMAFISLIALIVFLGESKVRGCVCVRRGGGSPNSNPNLYTMP